MTSLSVSASQMRMVLQIVLLVALLPSRALGSIANCGYCVCERNSMTCDFDSVKDRIRDSLRLDQLIASDTEVRSQGLESAVFEDLYVNCKNSPLMQDQRLTRAVLSHLTGLKKVALLRCGLTTIDPDAFDRLSRLEEFDASDNKLEMVPLRVFSRLKMKLLKLSENRRLRLEPDPVYRVSVKQLILTKCDLVEFPTAALDTMDGLNELTMSENLIRYVPSSALIVVAKLKVFYLDDNPLVCTCANKWLRESVNWDVLSPSVMRKSKLPTCKSPFNLMDIELTKVEPSRFLCSPPRISRIDVSLQRDSASLACLAQADERSDQLPLKWQYQRSLPDAAAAEASVDRGPEFRRVVRRTPGLAREQFALRVSNSDGQATEFNLTIAWPPELPPPLPPPPQQPPPPQPPAEATEESPAIPEKTSASGGSSGGGGQQRPGHQAVDNNKQFTLLEMIIAVIGTFMSTSLVFLLSCQFVRWYKRRDKKLWASYAQQHPQQQHHPYSATYNYNPHQASSHEYDVPRIDQPCLPKPPPPPPLSQMPPGTLTLNGGGGGGAASSSMSSSDREFLDYNNPRLMYNV